LTKAESGDTRYAVELLKEDFKKLSTKIKENKVDDLEKAKEDAESIRKAIYKLMIK